MSEVGFDYGNGASNINHETGIRYGVVPIHAILQGWADSAEPDYGPPVCPKCGKEAKDTWGGGYQCLDCGCRFPEDEAYGDDPIAFVLDDGVYKAESDGDGDIFVTKSPYYTHAQFCSPCAPGACYLLAPTDKQGEKAYCFAPDWFEAYDDSGVLGRYSPNDHDAPTETACPYPVYRVSDGECIYQPVRK